MLSDLLPGSRVWKEKKKIYSVNTWQTKPGQEITVKIHRGKPQTGCYLQMDVMKMSLHSVVFLPQSHTLSNNQKNVTKS